MVNAPRRSQAPDGVFLPLFVFESFPRPFLEQPDPATVSATLNERAAANIAASTEGAEGGVARDRWDEPDFGRGAREPGVVVYNNLDVSGSRRRDDGHWRRWLPRQRRHADEHRAEGRRQHAYPERSRTLRAVPKLRKQQYDSDELGIPAASRRKPTESLWKAFRDVGGAIGGPIVRGPAVVFRCGSPTALTRRFRARSLLQQASGWIAGPAARRDVLRTRSEPAVLYQGICPGHDASLDVAGRH